MAGSSNGFVLPPAGAETSSPASASMRNASSSMSSASPDKGAKMCMTLSAVRRAGSITRSASRRSSSSTPPASKMPWSWMTSASRRSWSSTPSSSLQLAGRFDVVDAGLLGGAIAKNVVMWRCWMVPDDGASAAASTLSRLAVLG